MRTSPLAPVYAITLQCCTISFPRPAVSTTTNRSYRSQRPFVHLSYPLCQHLHTFFQVPFLFFIYFTHSLVILLSHWIIAEKIEIIIFSTKFSLYFYSCILLSFKVFCFVLVASYFVLLLHFPFLIK